MQTDTAKNVNSVDESLVDSLMKGAIDLHCHSGPSVMPRRFDHLDAMNEASAAGMKAVLIKDHYYIGTPVTELLNKHYSHLGVKMLSGVPLNNPSGGINPYAVDHGLRLGARLVWMPTFSAGNHIEHNARGKAKNFPSAKERMLEPAPLTALDANGKLLDEVKVVLDLIADHDAVLSGGHLNITEIWMVFEEAKKRGVKRFLVNHPNFVLDGTMADVKALVEFGSYIEHSVCMFIAESKFKCFDEDILRDMITTGTVERTIMGSDLGQAGNPTPVEGFRAMIRLCLQMGYAPADVKKMVSTNAATLMGLELD